MNKPFTNRARTGRLPVVRWLMLLLLFSSSLFTQAQVSITTETASDFTGGNGVGGSSAITFVIRNNNSGDYILQGVDLFWQTANNNTNVTLWYSSTSLGGQSPIATPTWQAINSAGPIAVPSNGYYTTFTGMTFIIPGNTTYRFAVESTNGIRYSGTVNPLSVNTFSNSGIDLIVNEADLGSGIVGNGGNFPNPINTPRAFTGRIHLIPATACSGAPTAGAATANPSIGCQASTVNLSLTGNTVGTGLTYQWFESQDNISFSTITGATTQNYTATVNFAGPNYYRCIVTCSNSFLSDGSGSVSVSGNAQLSGTYTIDNTNATGGTNFNNFADAFAALQCGSSGPVTMNVIAGQSFSSAATLVANFSGSMANPIVFQKSGAGANPSLAIAGTSGTADDGLRFEGADWITWDGIDIGQGGTTATNYMERAIRIIKANSTDGANHNIFRNFTIDLGGNVATTTRGVFMENTPLAGSPAGASNNNSFENLTITNAISAGIWLAGSGTVGNQDLNTSVTGCTIQMKSAAAIGYGIYVTNHDNFDVSGNTVGNYNLTTTSAHYPLYVTGTVAVTNGSFNDNVVENITNTSAGIIYGIYVFNGGNLEIARNTIRNLSTASNIRGIYLNGVGTTVSDVHRNRIYNITNTATAATYAAGIQSGPGVNRIYNNMITGILANSSTATPGVRGIEVTGGVSHALFNNTVIVGGSSASSAAFAWSTVVPTFDIRNNIFINNSTSATFAAAMYRSTAGNPTFAAGSGNNLYYAGTPSATRPIYRNATNSVQTIANYAALNVETLVYSEDVQFTVTNGEVTIDQTVATDIESGGQNIALIDEDYYGTARGPYPLAGQKPNGGVGTDVGAEENDFTRLIPANAPDCATLDLPVDASTDLCTGNDVTLSWTPAQTGPLPTGGYDVFFGTTNPPAFVANESTTSYTVTGLAAGTTYYWSVEPKNAAGNAAGCQVFSFSTTNHAITSTTPASRCGVGTVDLMATANQGTINWFANATGGAAIGTGGTFTTPTLSNDSTFYVSTNFGGSTFNTSYLVPFGTAATVLSTYGQIFTATQPFVLNSVQVFSTTGTAITISLFDATGNTQLATTGSVPVVAGSSPNIPLGFAIPGAGTYRLAVNGMTGNFIRDNSGPVYPLTLANGIGTIDGFHSAITGALTTSASYYFVYNWNVTTGCESNRVPVTATVTPADVVNISPSTTTSCPGDQVNLSASSVNSNYVYTWMPGNLTGSFVQVNPTETTTYVLTADDGNCVFVDSVTINVNGAEKGTITDDASICFGDSKTITLTGSVGAIQWQYFDGTVWQDLVGETSASVTVTPSVNTDYRAELDFTGCAIIYSDTVTLTVVNPQIASTMGDTRCGVGVVDLTATPSAMELINWYENASGGQPLATGTTFSPNIISDTTFYASAFLGSVPTNVGYPATSAPASGSGQANFGIVFEAISAFNLSSVTIYPISATSSSGTITVEVIDGNSVVLHTGTFNIVGSPGGVNPVVLPLNFDVNPGTNLKLRAISWSGITGLNFQPSADAPLGNWGYPFVIPGVVSLNHSTLTAAPTNTPRLDLYYYFYNWVVGSGCESPRVPVSATITAPDPLTVSSDINNICPNELVTLSVSSVNTNYTYTWEPGTLTGASIQVTPLVTTTYYVTGDDGICGVLDSITITVQANSPIAGTASATATNICQSASTTLNLTGSNGDIIWQRWDGSMWVDETGPNANTASYSITPVASGDYRARVSVVGCPAIFSNTVSINVFLQLSGTYTIDNTNATGGTNFNNFADAFAALQCGSSGPVTMNVIAGQSFSSAATLVANFSGSMANPIVFQKSGVGANPSLAVSGTSVTTDDGLRFEGADWITWDGIDIVQGGTSATNFMERGIRIIKANATDGANNNTFRNFTIDLGANVATTTRGVFLENTPAATSAAGASNNNSFENLSITNAISAGIWLAGSATVGNQDLNTSVTGCTIQMKSASAIGYGIYVTNHDGFDVSDNTVGNYSLTTTSAHYPLYVTGTVAVTNGSFNDNNIENITNTSAGIIYGIYVFNGGNLEIARNIIRNLSTATTIRAIYLNGVAATTSDVHRNRIYNITNTASATSYAAGIQSGPGINRIYNNMITGILANNSTATPGVRGIDVTGGVSHALYNNTVIVGGSSASSAAFAWSTVAPTFDIRNNIFINNSTSATFAAAMYRSTAGNPTFAPTSGNNLYYAGTPSATRPIYRNATNSVQTLANYVALNVESVVYSEDVQFTVTNGEVTIDQTVATDIESGGQNLALVDVDYYGTARGPYPLAGQKPNGGVGTDVGAEENDFTRLIPANAPDCATLNAPANNLTDVCTGNSVTLSWTAALTGPSPTSGFDVFFGTSNPPAFVANESTTSYTVSGLAAGTTYYWSVEPKNAAGNATGCQVFSFSTTNHAISSTTPASRCGVGTVNLSATANQGTINWYANATGGAALGTGATFTTPPVATTTDFYVSTNFGGSTFNTSYAVPFGTAATNLTTYGQIFTATQPFTLNSVQVFSTTGTAITISLFDATGTTLLATTGSVPVVAGSSPNIPLGFAIPGAGTYRLAVNGMTGNFIRDNSGPVYPLTLANGIGTIDGFHSSITGALATSASYYFVYNWNVTTGCESPRVPVTATVTSPDAITVLEDVNDVCPGDLVNISVSSLNTNYVYTWMPGNVTGASIAVNPTTITTYVVTADDGTCVAVDSVTINVLPGAVAGTATSGNVCITGSAPLSLIGSTGAIQWQRWDGAMWVNETGVGSTTANYSVSPTVATDYRASVTVLGCPPLFSNTVTVLISNPQVLSTTGDDLCGPGSATVSATANAGSDIYWYAGPTGGSVIGIGNTFTTAVSSDTTFYAQATTLGSIVSVGKAAPTATLATTGANWGLVFDVNEPLIIQSVDLYPTAAGSITVELRDNTGALLQTVGTYSYPTLNGTTPFTINLDLAVNPGTGYRLVSGTGMTGSLIRDTGGNTYPYNSPNNSLNITSGFITNPGSATYYWFYNWQVATGCNSTRMAANVGLTTGCATPANDDCADAQPITLAASALNGTTFGATASGGNTTCSPSGTLNDVWYSFNTGNNVRATVTANRTTASGSYGVALYTSCSTESTSPAFCQTSSGTINMMIDGLSENTTYFLRVYSIAGQEVNFNLDVVGNGVTGPQLRSADCGKMDFAVGGTAGDNNQMRVVVASAPLGSRYFYQVRDASDLFTLGTIVAPANSRVQFADYPAIFQFGNTYTIRVVRGDRFTVPSFVGATSCTIGFTTTPIVSTIPLTQIAGTACGSQNYTLDPAAVVNNIGVNGINLFNAEVVVNATSYDFEISDNNNIVLGIVSSNFLGRVFVMNYPSIFQYGQTYNIRVRAIVGTVVGDWGNVCTIGFIQSPSLVTPSASALLNCNMINVESSRQLFRVNVAGANRYTYNFYTDATANNFYASASTSSATQLRAGDVTPGLLPNTTYYVTVTGFVGGVPTPAGDTCALTTASVTPRFGNVDLNGEGIFGINAYPNPFAGTATVVVSSSSDAPALLNIYDVAGKLITSRQVAVNQTIEVGDGLAAGHYILEAVRANGDKATFRLAKTN